MSIRRNLGTVVAFVLLTEAGALCAQQEGAPRVPPGDPAPSTPPPGESTDSRDPQDAAGFTKSSTLDQRTEINLLGQTDTGAGESRRNENIQFNLVDNNALKELRVRLGTTATIIEEFKPTGGYFGAEFGASPKGQLHVSGSSGAAGVHGSLYELHQNSVFTARSFFQVGDVQPAAGERLWIQHRRSGLEGVALVHRRESAEVAWFGQRQRARAETGRENAAHE